MSKSDNDDDAINFTAPVASVTLLEDRARVTRRGSIKIDTSNKPRAQLVIDGVAPVIVEKTLTVRVTSVSATVSVADARVARRLVSEVENAEQASSEHQKLVVELRERRATASKRTAEVELLVAEADGLNRLATWTLGELADDVSLGRGLSAETTEQLVPLRARERELRVTIARDWHQLTEFNRGTERLEARINELAHPADRRSCRIYVDLDVSAAANVEFEIEYVVPAAMWRPAHRATLVAGEDGAVSAEISTSACVWQRSGEDWNGAQLYFSTERASLGADPPVLSTDTLAIRKRADTLDLEMREEEIDSISGRGGGVTVTSELPGIDDCGAIVSLKSQGPVSVDSDGRAHRVPLAEFSTPARVALWTYPELSDSVIYRTVLTNRGEWPLLAGPVELVREGGWVGRTSIGFVAPGEEFELSWGPEPTLRARREVIVSKEESRSLSSWKTRRNKVVVRLSNLGRQAQQLSVRERLPVSEIEKVKVEFDAEGTSEGVTPDEDGFITWELSLEARETRRLEFRYALKKHSDVVGV